MFTPVAYASVETLVYKVDKVVLNPLIVLMFAVAIATFLFGVVEFMANRESEDARKKGQQHMIWGVVGLFIMIAVWGILKILLNTFGITGVNLG